MLQLNKKRICLAILCLVISSFAFAWTVYQDKDEFGDFNGKYYLYDQGIFIELSESYLRGGQLIITFGSSEYGYYQADNYHIQLKEADGTVHSYWTTASPTLFESDAIEVYDIFLRNQKTKVYVYYSFGYGHSFTFEVNNYTFSNGIDELKELSNLPSDIQGTITKDFRGADGGLYSLQVSTNPFPDVYDFLVSFSVMKYSSDGKFAGRYLSGDLGKYASNKVYNTLEIKSGDREEAFSRRGSYDTLIKNSDLKKLDRLLIGEETTISIPEFDISVNMPTDELRNLLELSPAADKIIEEKEAEELRESFKLSSSFSFLVGAEPSVVASTEELPESEHNDDSGSNILVSLKYTQMLFKFIYAAASVDGSFGGLGKEIGLSADLGIGFKYLHFGARIPLRFQLDSSSLFVIPPQFFIEGFIPLKKGGIIIGASMSIENTNKDARGFIYLGYSLKTKDGSFATWGYK